MDSKASPRWLLGRQREEQAMQLHLAGATYRVIGERLGITERGAHKAVMRALERLNEKLAEEAGQVRQLELERLDRLLLAHIEGLEATGDRWLLAEAVWWRRQMMDS